MNVALYEFQDKRENGLLNGHKNVYVVIPFTCNADFIINKLKTSEIQNP